MKHFALRSHQVGRMTNSRACCRVHVLQVKALHVFFLLLSLFASATTCMEMRGPPSLSPAYLTHLQNTIGGSDSGRAMRLAVLHTWVFPPATAPAALQRLRCHLQLLAAHLVPATPADVLVFTRYKEQAGGVAAQSPLQKSMAGFNYPWAHYLPIHKAHWALPAWLPPRDEQFYWTKLGGADYKLMGQWRSLFAFRIAAALGYEYALVLDEDLLMTSPPGFDLLAFAKAQHLDLAVNVVSDSAEVTWGLPELAAFFLVSERMQPAGPLFAHCTPPSAAGLVTQPRPGSPLGFNRTTLYTNFLLARTAFWMSPKVQEFVRLATLTGGQVRYRWQEQAVASMVRLLFVPDSRFHVFDGAFGYVHDKHLPATKKWCPNLAAAIP